MQSLRILLIALALIVIRGNEAGRIFVKQNAAINPEAEQLDQSIARTTVDCVDHCEVTNNCSVISFDEQFKTCRMFELICGKFMAREIIPKSYKRHVEIYAAFSNEGYTQILNVNGSTAAASSYDGSRTLEETSAVNLFDGLKTDADCTNPFRMLLTAKETAPWVRFQLKELARIEMVRIYNREFAAFRSKNIEVRIAMTPDNLSKDESLCHYHAGQIPAIAELECTNVTYGETILITQNNDAHMNLLEVEVIGCSVKGTNLITFP